MSGQHAHRHSRDGREGERSRIQLLNAYDNQHTPNALPAPHSLVLIHSHPTTCSCRRLVEGLDDAPMHGCRLGGAVVLQSVDVSGRNVERIAFLEELALGHWVAPLGLGGVSDAEFDW